MSASAPSSVGRMVTLMELSLTESELTAQPMAGALLAIDTDVRGLPEPRLAAKPAAHAHF